MYRFRRTGIGKDSGEDLHSDGFESLSSTKWIAGAALSNPSSSSANKNTTHLGGVFIGSIELNAYYKWIF